MGRSLTVHPRKETPMFRTTGPVFAAVRLDESADEVLRQAVEIARHYGVKLYVCHVLPDVGAVRPLFPQLQMEDALRTTDFEAGVYRALSERVAAFTPPRGKECELKIEYGTEHAAIIDAAEQVGAGMIVVGHGSEKHRLGGISERVVRHAHCPVLVARPPEKGGGLAATDFSDPSTPAVDAAASEAGRRGRELRVVHAFDILRYGMVTDPTMPGLLPLDFSAEIEEALRGHLDECVRRVGAAEGLLVRGAADRAVVETAEKLEADLVVVATRGRTGLAHLALGSVAEAVVRGAACSVLVVRMKA